MLYVKVSYQPKFNSGGFWVYLLVQGLGWSLGTELQQAVSGWRPCILQVEHHLASSPGSGR